jgi:hypothetical protein
VHDLSFAYSKEALGLLAIALTIYAFFPYIRSIHKGETKPHMFSWILWGATTFIVFLAQYSDEGGAGAWPIGVSGIITLYVAGLAYVKKSDISITKTDWMFFFNRGMVSSTVVFYIRPVMGCCGFDLY